MHCLKKSMCTPCIPKPGFAIVRPPPQHTASGAEKGSMLVRFFEAKRKKTVDAKQQMSHNLASLLLTNTTLRSSRQVPRGGRQQIELPGSLTTNNR